MDIKLKKNISLKPFNTFGIDVETTFFTRFESSDQLTQILETDIATSNELFIIGGGSNILLTKKYNGLVLKNEVPGFEAVRESNESVFVKVGAGIGWHDFVMQCISCDYAGVENLSLIPGNVGAAPMQNIGAYGTELKDVFHQLEAYDIENKKIVKFSAADCDFGYRESVFKKELKNKMIILNVTFELKKKPTFKTSYGAIQDELKKLDGELSIAKISQAVINIRQSKLPDPTKIGNAGSFFKNPVIPRSQAEMLKGKFPDMVIYPVSDNESKVAAGWLIDNLGWKGKTIENYGVHKKQALVLVNYGGASGNEIFKLSTDIIDSVKDAYGIDLQREVNIY